MKKIAILLISVLLLCSLLVPFAVADSGKTYTDKTTGLTFTIPAGWKEEALSKEREIIKAKFVPENVDSSNFAAICFGYADLWSNVPAEYKSYLTRADIDSSLFTLEDIKEMMGTYSSGSTTVSVKDITTIKYNGIEYYRLSSSSSSYGITMPMIQLMYVDNGYMYQFQFMGDTSGRYYKDFESLVKSATYKTSKPVATATPKATEKPTASAKATTAAVSQQKTGSTTNYSSYSSYNRNSDQSSKFIITLIGIALWALIPGFIAKHKGRSFAGYYFLSFLITPLVTTIITLCLKNLNKTYELKTVYTSQPKEKTVPVEPIAASTPRDVMLDYPSDEPTQNEEHSVVHMSENATIPEDDLFKSGTGEETRQLRFCRYCGFELLSNSEFCSHCGKKVL